MDIKFNMVLVDTSRSVTAIIRLQEDVDNFDPEIPRGWTSTEKPAAQRILRAQERRVLIYSTCSLKPKENEVVVNRLLRTHKRTEVKRYQSRS